MSAEQNEALVRRHFDESWNQQDDDAVDEIFAEDFVGYSSGSSDPIRGREGVKQSLDGYLSAFPNLQMTIEELVADDDKVAVRWFAEGTHNGDLLGMPPTGKSVEVGGIDIFTIVDEQIREAHGLYDQAGLMQQLGAGESD